MKKLKPISCSNMNAQIQPPKRGFPFCTRNKRKKYRFFRSSQSAHTHTETTARCKEEQTFVISFALEASVTPAAIRIRIRWAPPSVKLVMLLLLLWSSSNILPATLIHTSQLSVFYPPWSNSIHGHTHTEPTRWCVHRSGLVMLEGYF